MWAALVQELLALPEVGSVLHGAVTAQRAIIVLDRAVYLRAHASGVRWARPDCRGSKLIK